MRSTSRLSVLVCFLFAGVIATFAQEAIIAGAVKNAQGVGIAGVPVQLISHTADPRKSVTDKSGAYFFSKVPSGEGYVVKAFVNGEVLPSQPITVHVGDYRVVIPDLVSSVAAPAIQFGSITGKIVEQTDSGEVPLAAAHVRIRSAKRGTTVTVTTDDSGSFARRVNIDDTYTVTATYENEAIRTIADVTFPAGRTAVQLPVITYRMPAPEGVIAGEVYEQSGSEAKPAANVSVLLESRSGKRVEAKTDARGQFRFGGLSQKDSYTVTEIDPEGKDNRQFGNIQLASRTDRQMLPRGTFVKAESATAQTQTAQPKPTAPSVATIAGRVRRRRHSGHVLCPEATCACVCQ